MWYEDREPGVGFTRNATVELRLEDPSGPGSPSKQALSLRMFLTVSSCIYSYQFPAPACSGQGVNKGQLLRGPCTPDRPGMPNRGVRHLFAADPRYF